VGGTDKDCASATVNSMNKVKDHDKDDTHLLNGNTTDSGGGGTLENLADESNEIEHVREKDDYLVANCTLHALQLQLSNAVKETFGEGALDKINAMQAIHSVYRLQESIDLGEWRHVLFLSSQFVINFDPTAIITNEEEIERMSAVDRNQNTFWKAYHRSTGFHSAFKKPQVDPDTLIFKRAVLQKMTASSYSNAMVDGGRWFFIHL